MVPPHTRVLDRFGQALRVSLGDDNVIEMSKPSSSGGCSRLGAMSGLQPARREPFGYPSGPALASRKCKIWEVSEWYRYGDLRKVGT
jgi:hypothetical protein